ncbi:MAG: hypothetical protein ACUVYA_11555 [Planctomycetota bacterium]
MIRARFLPAVVAGAWLGISGGFAAEAGKAAPKEGRKEAGKGKPAAKAAPEKHDLETWGVVKPVKGTEFWELKYAHTEGGRRLAKTAYFKPAADATFYTDRAVPVTDLKENEEVWLFGKRFEQEVPALPGMPGTDRQMKNVAAIVAGEAVEASKDRTDPKDPSVRWFRVTVAKPGAALYVIYDAVQYKVVAVRDFRVMRREEGGDAKRLKSGMYVAVALDKTEERPNTGKSADAKKECFVAKSVAILDPKLVSTLYPLLYE